jgi:hypothetical protein
MLRPKRRVLVISGGLAALLVAITCAILLNSTARRESPVLEAYDVAEPPARTTARVSSGSPTRAMSMSYNYPASAHPGVEPSGDSVGAAAIPVSVPQIAYSFTLGYRLPASAIAGAQQAHIDLCNRLGPRCQLVAMQRASGDDGTQSAHLKLRVASAIAQQVSGDLTTAVGKAGGRAVDTQISAEDVSKDLVDTDARLRQREILVARLTDMLRGRQGKVGELVEAERSVAQAQEELDQAKGWLGELRRRVAYSDFSISYSPVTAPVAAPTRQGFLGQIGDAIAQSGAAVAGTGRTLLLLVIYLAPWALIAALLLLAARPLLRRWRNAGLVGVNEDV